MLNVSQHDGYDDFVTSAQVATDSIVGAALGALEELEVEEAEWLEREGSRRTIPTAEAPEAKSRDIRPRNPDNRHILLGFLTVGASAVSLTGD